MLLTRCACLPSVSGVAQGIRHEAATYCKRVALKRKSALCPLTFLLTRAMYTTPPRLPQVTSPPSNSRWKRGRPVASRSNNIIRPLHISHSSRHDTSMAQSVASPHDRGAEASTIEESQHLGLQTSSQSLRFMSTTRVEAGPSVPAAAIFGAEHKLDINCRSTSSSFSSIMESESGENFVLQDVKALSSTKKRKDIHKRVTPNVSVSQEQSSDSDYITDENGRDESEPDNNTDAAEEDAAEEHVPLAYQIPDDVLRSTMQASPNTRASYWSTNLYRGPKGEKISVHYCQTMEVAERVTRHFLKEKVVGFDIEWKPWGHPLSIKQNASLIQLASEDRIALFHIALFSGSTPAKLMPPSLKIILESPNIIKVGAAVKGDFTRLEKFLDVHAEGVFELSRLHNLVEWYETDPKKVTNRLVGLSAQVLQHLQLPLYKGSRLEDEPENKSSVRESDWSKVLDLQQIHYAATDAYAGFRLYHVLEWKRKQLKPLPPPIQLCDYDSKPAPKSKELHKSSKSAAKLKATEKTDSESITSTQETEVDDTEDSEEFMNTIEPEVLSQSSSSSTTSEATDESDDDDAASNAIQDLKLYANAEGKKPRTRKRVGKVKLSWIPGPDPGYPILPQDPSESTSGLSEQSYDTALSHSAGLPLDKSTVSHPLVVDVESDNEQFSDPELEKALSNMELDNNGELRDVTTKGSGSRGSSQADQLLQASLSKKGTQAKSETKPLAASTSPPELDASPLSEYAHATAWAQIYLQSTIPSPSLTTRSRIRATVSHLRAYHMWAYQKLSPDDITKQLRDPPLSMSTVVGYIVQAISLEELEYDKEALKDMLTAMPKSYRQGRWKWLSEKVDALG